MTSRMQTKKRWYKNLQADSKAQAVGIANGFRSGLESKISKQITDAGLELSYETDKITYHMGFRRQEKASLYQRATSRH